MSKRILAVFLVLGVLAGSQAFASNAHTSVMGSGDPIGVIGQGSFFYDDNYNIFYNPSYANDFKNWASIEKAGNSSAGTRAEGGFVANVSNMNVGVFLDRANSVGGTYSSAATTPIRPIDIIVAGDAGMKWGVGATFSSFRTDSANSASELNLSAGVQVMDFDPFVSFMVMGKETVAGADGNKNTRMMVGTRYHWGEWLPYGAFVTAKTTAVGGEAKTNSFGVGLGRNAKVSDGVRLNYAIGVWSKNTKTTPAAGTITTTNNVVIPIDLSVEGDATDWLMLRAGLNYHLTDQKSGVTTADNTTGRIGAAIKVKKTTFEWAVGHTAAGGAGAAGTLDGNGFDLAGGFFTNAGMTYHW